MKLDETAYRINRIGEFADRQLEKEFFAYDMGRAQKYIRPLILSLGTLYLLFIIPDYFLVRNPMTFLSILANRAGFFLLILIFSFAVDKIGSCERVACWITAYEMIGTASFLIIFGQYENPNFLIQTFGLMILISGIFLAPNKWINTVVASTLISVAFFQLSGRYVRKIAMSEYSAGIVYIIIVLAISGLSSFRSNYYNRKQYIYSRQLLSLSTTDPLTGVYNRTKIDEELDRWVRYSKRQGRPLSVVFFDIDDFKKINDTFGHLAGDRVIVDIVKMILDNIRQSDVLARWGGDEFILLLPNTGKRQAAELAEKLRSLVAGRRFENVGNLTCSFGLVAAEESDSADLLLNRADQLLYSAKKHGKNIVAG